jgi:DNA replication protein DnaC
MNTHIKNCITCNIQFNADSLIWNGKPIFEQNYCTDCLEQKILEQSQKDAINASKIAHKEFWDKIPPLYRDTDKSRLNANLVRAIDAWEYNTIGLGFTGESGAGKTRSAILLLQRFHKTHSFYFLKATRLTQFASEKFSDEPRERLNAKQTIGICLNCKILLLDDIGKGRLTPAAEELLFDMIDTRSERGLPIIWTSNANSRDMLSMFSQDRGTPILRRLVEFSTIVNP